MRDYHHDIDRYLRGEMTPQERHALEKEALADPFLADALEGTVHAHDSFDSDVKALNEALLHKKGRRFFINFPMSIAASIVLLIVATVVIWQMTTPDDKQLTYEKQVPAEQPATTTDSLAEPEATATTSPATGPDSTPVMEPQQATVSRSSGKPAERTATGIASSSQPVTTNTYSFSVKDSVDALAKADEPLANKAEEKEMAVPVQVQPALDKAVAQESTRQALAQESKKKTRSKDAQAMPSASSEVTSNSNTRRIRGVVTSSEDGQPLPGVNVLVKGTTTGTVTNAQGEYDITVNDNNAVLAVNFIGLQSQEVTVGDRSEINVTMTQDVTQLSEVVVTGYGGSSDRDDYTPSIELAHPEPGYREFRKYLETNQRYPEAAKASKTEGRVTIEFSVEPDGSLSNFTVIRGIGSGCDEELIRLIKEGPRWIATRRDGVAVKDNVRVRLKFSLPK